MIENKFEEAFTPEWVEANITDSANELVVLRNIIPWQKIIYGLIPFYDDTQGRSGVSLRIVTGVFIVQKLRQLSDRDVISQVGENRYIQYFCNVPDECLKTFIQAVFAKYGSVSKRKELPLSNRRYSIFCVLPIL